MVIQDVVRGFSCVRFLIYVEFRYPQKSLFIGFTEGWWVYVSIKYTQICNSAENKFISLLQKVCVHGGENSIPVTLFLFPSILYSPIFSIWPPWFHWGQSPLHYNKGQKKTLGIWGMFSTRLVNDPHIPLARGY